MRSKSSGKAAAKGAHDRKQKGGTTNNPLPPFNFPLGVSEPKSQTMQMPRTKLGSESPRLQRIRRPSTAHQDLNPSSAPTRQSKDVSEATAMAMAIMEQARSEKDSPQKDKLVSLAAVSYAVHAALCPAPLRTNAGFAGHGRCNNQRP